MPPPLLAVTSPPADDGRARRGPTWEQFGREILVRQLRQKAGSDRSAYLDGQIAAHRMGATALASTSYLTNDEQRALKKGLGNQYPQPRATSTSPKLEPNGAAMRTIPTLWPGFLKSLFEASGCRPTPERDPPGVVSAKYRREHRTLQAMSISPTKISAECTTALTALARLTLVDRLVRPTKRCRGVPRTAARSRVLCMYRGTARNRRCEQPRSTIVPPKRLVTLKPTCYPSEAQRQRVQGTVVIEATISATGCITSAKVIRGRPAVDGLLGAAGGLGLEVHADATWDRPVPVIMTVTVNFSLN